MEQSESAVKDALIQDITKRYQKHPAVSRQLAKFMTGKPPQKSAEDSTSRYLQEIAQYRLLKPEEEPELFGAIDKALNLIEDIPLEDVINSEDPEIQKALIDMTAAYQIIYSTNLRLAVAIAKKSKGNLSMEFIDLISEGNYGLHKAITRFDINRGFKFSTYATWWVRQQVSRAVGDQSRLVRMPIHAHEAYLRLLKDMKEVAGYIGRDATAQDMAELYGEDLKKIELLLSRGANIHSSLDATLDSGKFAINFDEGSSYGQVLPQLAHDPFEELFDDASVREGLSEILKNSHLTSREEMIISLRNGLSFGHLYGEVIKGEYYEDILIPGNPMTLEQVGKFFGVTRERIRQIEAEAMAKVQAFVSTEQVDATLLPDEITKSLATNV